jgi:hypothetical protein
MRLGGLGAGLLAGLASLAIGAWAPLAPPAPAAAPGGTPVALPGAATGAPSLFGARVLGQAPSAANVVVQLYFRPHDAAGLKDLATAVSSPGSLDYHHFLTVPEFAARFGASPAQVALVDRYLRSQGLSVGGLEGDDLAQTVRGTAKHFDAAFGARLSRVRTAAGAQVIGSPRAPRLPADLAGSVALVDGLEPWVEETSDLVRSPPREQAAPVTATTCSGMADAGLTPAQLANIYGFKGFYSNGDEGQGETIGFIEYALADEPAVSTFDACTGAALNVYYVPTDQPPTQVDTEVSADVETIAALAPKATVVVYESNQSGTGLGPWQLAVSGSGPGGLPDVISSSWGDCEAETGLGSSYYQEEEALFQEAATQGQTVLVAAGDDGSEGCYDQTASQALAVDDPASVPDVTAVGGTGSDTPTGPQYVWNSRGASATGCLSTGCSLLGASGGGASSLWVRPSYQPTSLPQSDACVFGAQGCREVPDVSALAGDPYAQYCSGSVCGSGSPWVGFGGTSLAAPSWGAAVLLSESLCQTRIGFLNPLLYSDPTLFVGPVTSGNNDLSGTHNGSYTASPTGGYSMATGLGYLGGANLSYGALCGAGNLLGEAPPPTTSTSTTTTTAPISPGPVPAASACGNQANQALRGTPVAMAASTHSGCAGYWVVSSSGDVAAFGSALNYGSSHAKVGAPVVAMAATPDYDGYWLLTSKGGVTAFGDATFYGGPSHLDLGSPAVGIASTPDGQGYWVVTGDGGVFAYGDARFRGSMGARHLNRPITGIAASPQGMGYWLVGADGGVFGFGDVAYAGSLGSSRLNRPIVGITAAGGAGYRLVASDGGVFAFGSPFYGSMGDDSPTAAVVMMAPSVDGMGYYLLDAAGAVFPYGDAAYLGHTVPAATTVTTAHVASG